MKDSGSQFWQSCLHNTPGVCNCRAIWLQLWIVELLVTIRVLPLEALSYVVITLPFTLPRILNLQLAVASAVKEGKLGNVRHPQCIICALLVHSKETRPCSFKFWLTAYITGMYGQPSSGQAALRRSAELVKGFRWPVLFLLVGTLGAAR